MDKGLKYQLFERTDSFKINVVFNSCMLIQKNACIIHVSLVTVMLENASVN